MIHKPRKLDQTDLVPSLWFEIEVHQYVCAYRITSLYVCMICATLVTMQHTHTHRQLLTGYTSRVRPIPCRCPILDTIGHSCTDTDNDTDTGLYKFFVLKMRFYVEYRCVQVICMRGICIKIRYRLETIGVRCNSVDC